MFMKSTVGSLKRVAMKDWSTFNKEERVAVSCLLSNMPEDLDLTLPLQALLFICQTHSRIRIESNLKTDVTVSASVAPSRISTSSRQVRKARKP